MVKRKATIRDICSGDESKTRGHKHESGGGGGGGAGCHPSYPDFCMPPPRPTSTAVRSPGATSQWLAQTPAASMATTMALAVKRSRSRWCFFRR